ncbi:hypothetical protein FQN60_011460 [Etheostoma spectabile]|uniref:Uncharacterized protein n=1 Tax=Etheostoma spectabile TaxID=54343 RepID=A0A5J5CDQ9_9PERO|nr:hypothetical protein FQN60_011460 [Etheostoma spectabile]
MLFVWVCVCFCCFHRPLCNRTISSSSASR